MVATSGNFVRYIGGGVEFAVDDETRRLIKDNLIKNKIYKVITVINYGGRKGPLHYQLPDGYYYPIRCFKISTLKESMGIKFDLR